MVTLTAHVFFYFIAWTLLNVILTPSTTPTLQLCTCVGFLSFLTIRMCSCEFLMSCDIV